MESLSFPDLKDMKLAPKFCAKFVENSRFQTLAMDHNTHPRQN